MSRAATPKDGVWRGEDSRYTREDALDDREFEMLVEGTYRLDGDYFERESRWVIFAAGRYGMRAGEIAHMRAEWIDWRRGMIVIPRHQTCDKGRDGGHCGYCRKSAQQMADHNEGLSFEEALEYMWSPKTEAGAREIPLEANTRAKIALERYFEEYDEFQASRGVVNRRVKRAAEAADEVVAADVYPHALRATAASFLAARGIDIIALKSMFGWKDIRVAQHYLAESGERTARALRDILP